MKVYEMAGNELRDSRFEILRICSMACIILGHYSWHGGVYFVGNEINKVIAGVFVFGSQLGVILFVIISAWFMGEQKQEFRVGGLIRIGCKTMIYAFICYLLYCVCIGWPSSIKNMFVQFIQMVEGYWFVIVYIGFMFLVPYLNTLIDELEKDKLGKLCAILLMLFCVLPTIFGSEFLPIKLCKKSIDKYTCQSYDIDVKKTCQRRSKYEERGYFKTSAK